MRRVHGFTCASVGMAFLLASSFGCGPGRTIQRTELRYPYAVPVGCETVADQTERVLRVTDGSGSVYIGELLSVDCDNLPVVVLDVYHGTIEDSIAVLPLAEITSVEVLQDVARPELGDAVGDALGVVALVGSSALLTLFILAQSFR